MQQIVCYGCVLRQVVIAALLVFTAVSHETTRTQWNHRLSLVATVLSGYLL